MPTEPRERRDWTDGELDLIVADYFSMLDTEIRRSPYDKSQHRKALMDKIDRSNSSIEFKHHNISAVLQQLELPWINGYKPRAHFQRSIIDAIDRYLLRHPGALHPEALASGIAERPQLFVEPPPKLQPRLDAPEVVRRLVRKFDPAERDFLNRKLGRNGEEMVFKFEQQRLTQLDRPDLARKVRWISQEEGDGAGYDILSFDLNGYERFLEVKTTVGSQTAPFYLTRNELSFSKERPKEFRIWRLYDFSKTPKMFEIAPPLERFVRLEPLSFEASFN
jgi:Protein NO VEIN, C-terminal